MALSAEWRTDGEHDAVIVVDDANQVRAAVAANPDVLSHFLTEPGDLHGWHSGHSIDGDKRDPAAWGALVIARAQSGEVLTMDPELFWNGIYAWFRSRGVDYDSQLHAV